MDLDLLVHSFISTPLCSDCKEEGGRPQDFKTNDANVPDSELRRAPHRVPYGSEVEAPDVIAFVYCMPAQALQLVCCTAFADHDAALSAAQSVGEIVLHEAFSQACGIIKGFDDVVPADSKHRSARNQQYKVLPLSNIIGARMAFSVNFAIATSLLLDWISSMC